MKSAFIVHRSSLDATRGFPPPMTNAYSQTAPPCPAPHVCYAYLIRHGATAASAAEPVVMQGRHTDAPLSADGLAQAAETSQFLAGRRLDANYTSPMLRARQTAETIGQPHGLSPQPVEALIEADLGTWEGLSWDEIKSRDPEGYAQFIARPDLLGYGGGENIAQLRDRSLPAINELMRKHLGQVIAIVTHRIVIRACVAELLGLPLSEARRISPSTCGLTLLRAGRDNLELVSYNVLFHLSEWATK
jgi:broad specificity phosphatase PhoE